MAFRRSRSLMGESHRPSTTTKVSFGPEASGEPLREASPSLVVSDDGQMRPPAEGQAAAAAAAASESTDLDEALATDHPEGDSAPSSDKGGPFSALTPSMRPSRELEDEEGDGTEFDEFGFRLEAEDSPEVDRAGGPETSWPISDNPQQRLKWIAHLEFAQSSDRADTSMKMPGKDTRHPRTDPPPEALVWDSNGEGITRTKKLREMVYEGIPHSLRPYIWMRLAGAISKRTSSEVTYKQIVRASSNDHLMTSKQIEKDLLRTLTTNICFANTKSTGIPRLRRILRGLAWLYPDIGYCQVSYAFFFFFL